MDPALARTLWHRLEAINAVTYFAPECREAPAQLGLAGFWMGYFAGRAAPLGPVGPGVVEATFYNFHPRRVRRAIPDAWERATPAAVLDVRAAAAVTALRRLLPDGAADELADGAVPSLGTVVEAADPAGRPLFAANRDVSRSADAVADLWQLATTLREHRGDGHVALLAGAGLDGCEVHVLVAATEGTDPELFLTSRGWSTDDWAAASERLVTRGLVADDGTATPAGRALRTDIEQRTDELAARPCARLATGDVERLLAVLGPAAQRIAAAGEVVFPNPMGLPRPAADPAR
ncbi:MAG: hypothetical protein PV358_16810 [Acidimicrobiales bacterium]|nr:hypothetical protein [Acidimicrobiales bacterium]